MRIAILWLSFATTACGATNKGFHPPVTTTRADAKQGESDRSFLKASPGAPDDAPIQRGQATWYGSGRLTANGERFDPTKHTAAHRKLPFGTWVEVRRVDTGRSVRVRINDRGPFGSDSRIIDVSRRAAEELEMIREGVVAVELRIVEGP